jgi:AcrR family transcriptional regulator
MGAVGLREQKKAETKAALSRAALDLAIDRGFDAVTVDAIAAAARVSTRTFRNYFSSKEHAVLFQLEEVEQQLVEAFLARDASEHVLDSMEAVAIDFVGSSGPLDQALTVTRLITQHPSLVAHSAALHHVAATKVLAEIGRRTGLDPDVELYPRLMYNAASSVTTTVVELLMSPTPLPEGPAELVRRGFDQLRTGLVDFASPPASRGTDC